MLTVPLEDVAITAKKKKRVEVHRCPSLSHQQPHVNRTPYKAHKQTSIPPQNVNIVPPKPHQKAHSASSSESATYVPPKLSLTNEAENYRVSHRNAVKDAPHYKVM